MLLCECLLCMYRPEVVLALSSGEIPNISCGERAGLVLVTACHQHHQVDPYQHAHMHKYMCTQACISDNISMTATNIPNR